MEIRGLKLFKAIKSIYSKILAKITTIAKQQTVESLDFKMFRSNIVWIYHF